MSLNFGFTPEELEEVKLRFYDALDFGARKFELEHSYAIEQGDEADFNLVFGNAVDYLRGLDDIFICGFFTWKTMKRLFLEARMIERQISLGTTLSDVDEEFVSQYALFFRAYRLRNNNYLKNLSLSNHRYY
ncbi:hypothetical protein TKK_0007587 [Trichogramma kaykai]